MNLTIYNHLLWLIILIPVIFFVRKTLVNRSSGYRNVAAFLRIAAITLLILALCRPFYSTSTDDSHVVYLMDVSASVDVDSLQEAAAKIRDSIDSLDSGDTFSVFVFANGIKPVELEKLDTTIASLKTDLASGVFRGKTTIADSLSSMKMVYPANKTKILCLFSDGVETEAELSPAIKQLEDEQIRLVFSKLARFSKPEVSVVELTSNTPQAYKGEIVRLKATLLSNYDVKVNLRFLTKGVVVYETPVELIANMRKEVPYEFAIQSENSGIWTAEVVAEKDYFPANNKESCSIETVGQAKLLALHNKPSKLRGFKKALQTQDVAVEVRGKFGVPGSFSELCEFDALMLADISANSFSFRQMEMIRKYVTEFGGGLIMTGSENSFGLGGYYKTPIEEVLPITSRYEKEKEHPSLAIVLIIDKSGSMGGSPIELARQAAKSSVEILSSRDQVGIVAFDGGATVVSELTSAVNKNNVMNQIDTIGSGGGTNMYPAMVEGRDMLMSASAKIKHMILLSDGQSSGGDFEGISAELSGQGVTISTVSLGQGAAVDLMAKIADIGRGRAYVTSNAEEMPRIFTKETVEASRSAIKEEPFLPVKISSSNSLAGIDIENAPYLLGYVMTKAKPAIEMQLLTETGDPLLAVGRFGLGQSAAFTSDVSDQWAGEWLEWNKFGKLWSQIIRSITRNKNNSNMSVTMKSGISQSTITLNCRDNQDRAENHIVWDTLLVDELGMSRKVAVEQVGLGRYSATFTPPAGESYAVRINDLTNNRVKTIFNLVKSQKEYQLSSRMEPCLEGLPRFNPDLTNFATTKAVRNSALSIFSLLAIFLLLTSTFFRRV